MTFREFTEIMVFISAAIDKKIAKPTVEAYYAMLGDLPAELLMAATKKVIASNEYPTLPTIGKLRKAAQDLCHVDRLSSAEAWGEVLKAIRQHGFYGKDDALKGLPENVAAIAEMMGWQEICHSESPDVIRAQFMRMYDSVETRKKDIELLPVDVQADIQNVIGKIGRKMLPGGID
jgi:di/tripeptidase